MTYGGIDSEGNFSRTVCIYLNMMGIFNSQQQRVMLINTTTDQLFVICISTVSFPSFMKHPNFIKFARSGLLCLCLNCYIYMVYTLVTDPHDPHDHLYKPHYIVIVNCRLFNPVKTNAPLSVDNISTTEW